MSGVFLGIRAVFLHDPGISLEGTSVSSTVCTSSEGSQEEHKHGKVSPDPGGTSVTSCESWDTWVLEILFLQPGTAEEEELLREYLHSQHCSVEQD